MKSIENNKISHSVASAILTLSGIVCAVLVLPCLFVAEESTCFLDYLLFADGILTLSACILCTFSGVSTLVKIKRGQTDFSVQFYADVLSAVMFALTLLLYVAALIFPHNRPLQQEIWISFLGIIPLLLHIFLCRDLFCSRKEISSTAALVIFSPVIGLLLICTAINLVNALPESSPAVVEEIPEGSGEFADINTLDFDGQEFTAADLKKYKVNVINIWATFCAPCIREMPDLDLISQEYDDVQVIGICWDVVDFSGARDEKLYSLAQKIVKEDVGVSYTMLEPSAQLLNGVLYDVFSFPTTFIVDENGNILEQFSGTRSKEQFSEIVEKYLD